MLSLFSLSQHTRPVYVSMSSLGLRFLDQFGHNQSKRGQRFGMFQHINWDGNKGLVISFWKFTIIVTVTYFL